METTVKDRLLEFLTSQRYSKAEFCRRIGVSTSYIDSMRKSISSEKLSSIAKEFPELNIEWLMLGVGDMMSSRQEVNVNGTSSIIINGENKMSNSTIDNRQYYSDSPDVLRAQIDMLDERIKEKDAQIKEKDAQINKLLEILNSRQWK